MNPVTQGYVELFVAIREEACNPDVAHCKTNASASTIATKWPAEWEAYWVDRPEMRRIWRLLETAAEPVLYRSQRV